MCFEWEHALGCMWVGGKEFKTETCLAVLSGALGCMLGRKSFKFNRSWLRGMYGCFEWHALECVCVGDELKFEWTETCMSVLSGGMHWVVCVGRKRSHITSHLWQSGHSHISSHSSSPANTLTQPSPKNSTEFDNIMLYWPQCKFSPQLEHQTAHFVCTLKQPRCTC